MFQQWIRFSFDCTVSQLVTDFSFCPNRHQIPSSPLLLPLFLFHHPSSPPLPPPQQSVNDKRKKNLFSRKFPFYKSKEASEQETSDVDRKYQRVEGGGVGGLSVWKTIGRRQEERSAGGGVLQRLSWLQGSAKTTQISSEVTENCPSGSNCCSSGWDCNTSGCSHGWITRWACWAQEDQGPLV